MKLGVAILAAGASVRMGRPKMLLPWAGTSVIGHIIRIWAEDLAAAQVSVVCAPIPSPVPTELDRLGFSGSNRIFNPAPERGMFSSIQCAAGWPGWDPNLTHFALVLGDQPHLVIETLKALIERAQNDPNAILQPAFNGKPRHPVTLPAHVFRDIVQTNTRTLRDFLKSYKRSLIALNDPGLELDLDYPGDYERALHLAAAGMAKLSG